MDKKKLQSLPKEARLAYASTDAESEQISGLFKNKQDNLIWISSRDKLLSDTQVTQGNISKLKTAISNLSLTGDDSSREKFLLLEESILARINDILLPQKKVSSPQKNVLEDKKEFGTFFSKEDGVLSFRFPEDDDDTIFHLETFDTKEEILEKTFVNGEDNSRDQGSAKESGNISEIASLITSFGQFMPAIGYKKDENSKISILDGSRRRLGCLKSGKQFKVLYASKMLTASQRSRLKAIFKSQMELSYYEDCKDYLLEFNEYVENNGDGVNQKLFHELSGVPTTTGNRKLKHARINIEIVNCFYSKLKLTEAFFEVDLFPVIKDVHSELGENDGDLALVNQLLDARAKFDDKDECDLPSDINLRILRMAQKSLLGASPNKSQKQEHYLLGSKGKSGDFVKYENTKSGLKITTKIKDEKLKGKFLELIEGLFPENESE